MENSKKNLKIRIVKDGPYIVSGNVPLSEKIITPKGHGYIYKDGRIFTNPDDYALCRCGRSKNAPYCDGSHERNGFIGTESASRLPYTSRARTFTGPGIDLMDDDRCAFARFCHGEHGDAWTLVKYSDDPRYRQELIKAASECPSGRLVAVEEDGTMIEPEYEPAVEILQDPQNGVSGPLSVKGNIPIESEDGAVYEIRNRATLCRCGKSRNKPFCDATHVTVKYIDK